MERQRITTMKNKQITNDHGKAANNNKITTVITTMADNGRTTMNNKVTTK